MKKIDLKDGCKDKKKELGASLVEYGLLVALVALIAIPAVSEVGYSVNQTVDDVLGTGAFTP